MDNELIRHDYEHVRIYHTCAIREQHDNVPLFVQYYENLCFVCDYSLDSDEGLLITKRRK